MKKIVLLLFASFSYIAALGQTRSDKYLPFVLLIDNEVPTYSDTHGVFLIKDSVGVVKDSVTFKYDVGVLLMTDGEYNKLFAVRPPNKLSLKIYHISLHVDTTYVYEKSIPIDYFNAEYPHGYMNKEYFIVKIFNKFDADARSKYYFKKGEAYLMQITIPGMGDVIPHLKKQ